MTAAEKEKVKTLWSHGWGAKRIAKFTGLNVNTVKTHCKRHLKEKGEERAMVQDGFGETWGVCKSCEKIITYTPGRKKKLFCSDSCRSAWWRSQNR